MKSTHNSCLDLIGQRFGKLIVTDRIDDFIDAINEYKLIEDGDKIAVCISGGKDSVLMAKCIQELIRHGKFKFEARFVCMNPGYNDYNLQYIKDNAKNL